jgi:hypothetical protein
VALPEHHDLIGIPRISWADEVCVAQVAVVVARDKPMVGRSRQVAQVNVQVMVQQVLARRHQRLKKKKGVTCICKNKK